MLVGRLLRNRGWVQLSEAEEPINTLKRAEVRAKHWFLELEQIY